MNEVNTSENIEETKDFKDPAPQKPASKVLKRLAFFLLWLLLAIAGAVIACYLGVLYGDNSYPPFNATETMSSTSPWLLT